MDLEMGDAKGPSPSLCGPLTSWNWKSGNELECHHDFRNFEVISILNGARVVLGNEEREGRYFPGLGSGSTPGSPHQLEMVT